MATGGDDAQSQNYSDMPLQFYNRAVVLSDLERKNNCIHKMPALNGTYYY